MSVTENSDVLELLITLLKVNNEKIGSIENRVDLIEKTVTRKESSKTILVVDDDTKLAQSYKLVLESEGYDVDTAYTAFSVLRRLTKKTYDLVILDWNLPDMLGNELALRIKKEHSGTDIILISGYSSAPSNVEVDHERLTKPINPESLLQITKNILTG